MTCPKCKQTFEIEKIEVGSKLDSDLEVFTQCANEHCDQRFYHFVPDDEWSLFEE